MADTAYSTYTYKDHTVTVGLQDLGNGYYNIAARVVGPYLNNQYFSKTNVPQAEVTSAIADLKTEINSAIDKAIPAETTETTDNTTTTTNTNTCVPGTLLDSSTSTYNNHTITAKKYDMCGTYKLDVIVSGPYINETVTKDGLTDATFSTTFYSVISDEKTKIDNAYNTSNTETTETTDNTGTETTSETTNPTETTSNTSASSTIYQAPNGKYYIIHYDPVNYPDTPYYFDGGHGVKFNKTLDEAKYVIDSTNASGVPNDQLGEYYTGTINWSSVNTNTDNTTTEGGTTTAEMTSGPEATIPLTGKEDVDKYLQSMAEYNTSLNNWLKANLDLNSEEWQQALNKIDDADLKGQIAERIQRLNEGFSNAADYLQSASELERRAQAIYSNENIRKIREKLIQRGFNTAAADTGAMFTAMKARAKLSADVYKIKSEFDKTLANLEAQRTQLEDQIRREGIEVDKWIIDKYMQVTQQIQELRKIYEDRVINNTDRYIMKPMIDIMSSNWQVELQQIAKEKEAEMLNANPTVKIMEASKIFGSDWAYVDSSVLAYANGDWGTFLTKAAESIRKNKLNEQKDLMDYQTSQQEELMEFQSNLNNE